MKLLIVVGNDKLGRKFINSIDADGYEIVLDESSSIKRIYKLIKRGVLKLSLIIKMFYADLKRNDFKLTQKYNSIYTNNDLINIVKDNNIEQVVLYRGGLIVNKKFLDTGVKILNIHCAKIPEYGGIGVIDRALRDKAYSQEATLHIITERIDEGRVLAVEPYQLSSFSSYQENEDFAYDAGIKLFNRYFN
jgi:methionyl-tRNA formyltransferase